MIPSVLAASLRRVVLDYLRATFGLADEDREAALFEFLQGPEGLFRDPWLELKLPFATAPAGAPWPLELSPPFLPFAHQLTAFTRLCSRDRAPQNTLVTTGTGSGKTESFLYPLLDHCRRIKQEAKAAGREAPGIKAIILYPMNALAADQARRIAAVLHADKRLAEVTAGIYVGGKGRHGSCGPTWLIDKRETLRKSPPDILLTNYRMLDFLLLRPDDRELWRDNGPGVLRYLVLDELHTYDGAQGSDVACLIRRLKDRLCGDRPLCAVGTSATIGEGDSAGRAALREFAGKIFGEPFEPGSIVTETRLEPHLALGDQLDQDGLPAFEAADLDPEAFPTREAWLERQRHLWLGAPRLEPSEMARRLRRHGFLRCLLSAMDGRPRPLSVLARRLERLDEGWRALEPALRGPVLDSLLALVSLARDPDDPERPFLQCRVQLWLRELRRLQMQVSDRPRFCWQETCPDEGATPGGHSSGAWLPPAVCRECGGSGWATSQSPESEALSAGIAEIGGVWLRSHRNGRYLQLREGEQRGQTSFGGRESETVCPLCLTVGNAARCGCANIPTLPARVEQSTSPAREGKRPRFLRKCPDCGTEGSLGILGARAASLLSVSITQLFLSPWNDDRKLIAFTDAVQEASHKAGFFSARTYRFNIRTAIQSYLEESGVESPTLAEVCAALLPWWRERLGDDRRLVATILPPDLDELREVRRFREQQGKGRFKRLLEDLERRLSWELTAELGLHTRLGRSLEGTRCATLVPDPAKLRQAAEALRRDVQEQALFTKDRRGAGPVERFLRGLLERLRRRGGIDHPLLAGYIAAEGKWFLLTKSKNPLLPPFGSNSLRPRLLHSHRRPLNFESWDPPAGVETWIRLWTARAFSTVREDQDIRRVLELAITRCAEAGLLTLHETGKGNRAAALDPAGLRVRVAPKTLRCAAEGCHEAVTCGEDELLAWEDAPCLRYRCEGKLALADEGPDRYYSRIYGSGELRRVFAKEHTGLIERRKREDLEEAFKTGANPEGPNVLVCTPTLELGVDVGDLSAVLLCSIPPTTPNYQQRIGRAGRRTGNAFCLAMAEARPHDLYFFDRPREMISGEVRPPGCYLDAPRMLERQLAAYALDRWVATHPELPKLPNRASLCLGVKGEQGFPGKAAAWIKAHAEALTKAFLGVFGPDLSAEHRADFADAGRLTAISEAMVAAFGAVASELDDLRVFIKRLRQRLKELEESPERFDGPEQIEELRAEYEDSLRVMGRVMKELAAKYPLNVLTDDGVLPNYAFPEPGVTLKSVVRRDTGPAPAKGDKGKTAKKAKKRRGRYEAFEYVRPASSAIRELAPFNTFYAEGRKVVIDEVDVGRGERDRIERWRLCPKCHHAEREDGGDPAAVCPRCSSEGWCDAGQLRAMIHFRRARSFSHALTSVTLDDRDDRESFQYETRDLIDVGPEHCRGARLLSRLPFGFELLTGLTLREMNFGPAFGSERALDVAGKRLAETGFMVCTDCGRVQKPKGMGGGSKPLDHAPHCKQRGKGKKEAEKLERVFLYREVESEALRLLLPVSTVEVEASLASFKAALMLGFRRHFQGNPGHLLIKTVAEPVEGSRSQRRYLVIYDGVPGGTGTLVELWNKDGAGLHAVLSRAVEALRACSCANLSGRDGCYRCIYAYQSRFDLPRISRSRALAMLRDVLREWPKMKEVATLSDTSLDDRLESELERRFVGKLAEGVRFRARAGSDESGAAWSEVPHGGQRCYKLTVGGVTWRLEPQFALDERHGVERPSRPDFLLRCLAGAPKAPKIAVFCDGFEWHGRPSEKEGRISDDILKRRAILASDEGYLCWSLTWADVEEYEPDREDRPAPGPLTGLRRDKFSKLLAKQGVSLDVTLVDHNPLAQLLTFLAGPSANWRGYAEALLATALTDLGPGADRVHELEQRLRREESRFEPGETPTVKAPPAVLGWFVNLDRVHILASTPVESYKKGHLDATRVLMRIYDEPAGRSAPDFPGPWRALLATWNLLQFHERCEVLGSEMSADDRKAVDPEDSGEFAALLETDAVTSDAGDSKSRIAKLVDQHGAEYETLLVALSAAGLALPKLGEIDIADEQGAVVAMAELVWPEARVAIIPDEEPGDQETARALGWTVLGPECRIAELIDAVSAGTSQ